jgi:protein-tyrosine-phosphatase
MLRLTRYLLTHELPVPLYWQLLPFDPERSRVQPSRAAGLQGHQRRQPSERPDQSGRDGIAVDGHASKSWHDLPLTPDVVVTVCGNAAGETCPAYLGDVVRTHWGLADPSEVQGTPADIAAAFEATYAIVLARVQALFALPLAELAGERAALKEALDRVGAC